MTTNSSKHRFFVDGPLITDDVYFDNEWHTVLIGTLGRGGQGLFALDVTNPNSPKLLWEYGAYNKELVEQNALPKKAPGYILAAPVIGPLSKESKGTAPDYVIFGNGYGSTAEDNTSVYTKGTSIAIEIATGELHSAIGREASDNNEDLGFAGVVGMKSNKTGYNKFGIERNTFYAGNTKGEMYLTVPLTTSATDVTGNKLVTNIPANRVLNNKTTPQSITAAPELFRAKISRQQVDLLFFGTGKYFEQQDSVDVLTARNSIYGLNVNGTNKVDSNSTINDLRARTVKDEEYQSTEMQRTYTVRTLEGENMNWTTNKGFYVDLPEGELVIDQPYSMGKVVFFMVMVMDTKDPCDPKTRYWLMAIDPLTGKTPTFPVFDLNGTGVDNPIISGVLLDSKPIIQGGSNAIAVTNNDRIKLMPYDASRVRTSRMIFQGDNFFKN